MHSVGVNENSVTHVMFTSNFTHNDFQMKGSIRDAVD